ncbi:MAG TPA: ABC transporter permease, partial [bacterium]
MFKSYFKIALRNLWKYKGITFINIFGLAMGIACCILIFLFVEHEFKHDAFHEKANRLYRVVIEAIADNEVSYSALQPYEVAAAFKENFPSVIRSTGYKKVPSWIRYQGKYFEEEIAFVDASFLSMFTFPLLAGDPNTALESPNSVIITKEIADKIFGAPIENYSNLIGKVLHLPKNKKDFIVTGILSPIPAASSISFSILVPFENQGPYPDNSNTFGNISVYVELDSRHSVKSIEQASAPLFEKIFAQQIAIWRAKGFLQNREEIPRFLLQPISDIYLNAKIRNGYESQSSAVFSYVMSSMAVIILVIACINFITLSIGTAFTRMKEVSMRKVLGAARKQFLFQFLGEACVLSMIALVMGVLFAELLTPLFGQIVQKNLHFSLWDNW